MKKIIVVLICAFFQTSAQSQKPLTSIKQLTDSIKSIVEQQKIPGLMVGITTKDSVLFSGGFGYSELKTKKIVNGRTLFRMGSITKSFVAIGIMQLIEKGQLNLNDELRKIAPEVPFKNQWEESNPIKIINLLEHTTGFDDFKLNKMYSLERRDYTTREMMLLQSKSMISRWRPNERHCYSNVNYAILGYIIRKVTGKEYDDYLAANICHPIGMTSSNFNLYSKNPSSDVKEYILLEDGLTEIPSVTFLIGPAGALWSCSDDMVKFLQMLLRSGMPLISESTLNDMEIPRSSLGARAGLRSGYALGNESFGAFRGHEGSLGQCSSKYLYNRDEGVGFVISCNGQGLGSIERLISDYFQKNRLLKKESAVPLNKKAIAPYLGYYQLETPRFDILSFFDRLLMLKVELINDTVRVNILGKKRKMRQTRPLTFADNDALSSNMVFSINADNKKVLVFNGRYTEHVPATSAIVKRILIVVMIVFALLSWLPAIITIFALIRKKVNRRKIPVMILPVLCTISLLWAAMSFFEVLSNGSYLLYKFGIISSISLGIFLGTSLFGVLSIANLVVFLRKFKSMQNRFVAWYMLATAISLFTLSVILLSYGWIGLRTWAM